MSLLRIVAKFHEEIYSDFNTPSGLNQVMFHALLIRWMLLISIQSIDFRAITVEHDEKLEEYYTEWNQRFKDDSDPNGALAIMYTLICVRV